MLGVSVKSRTWTGAWHDTPSLRIFQEPWNTPPIDETNPSSSGELMLQFCFRSIYTLNTIISLANLVILFLKAWLVIRCWMMIPYEK